MTYGFDLRTCAVCVAFTVGLAFVGPALATDAMRSASAVGQNLDQLAIAAHRMAVPVEARLAPAQSGALKTLGRNFGSTGNQAALLHGWQTYLATNRPVSNDINGLVAMVLREAYLQGSEDLRFYAARVQHMNDQKAQIREHLDGSGAGAPKATFRLFPGLVQSPTPPASDGGQLANVDLQNATQRQQQALQSTVNISKMMHDTAMAVIRKSN